jgi:hypothetical protein
VSEQVGSSRQRAGRIILEFGTHSSGGEIDGSVPKSTFEVGEGQSLPLTANDERNGTENCVFVEVQDPAGRHEAHSGEDVLEQVLGFALEVVVSRVRRFLVC